MMTKVLQCDELWLGEMRSIQLQGHKVLLVNLEGIFYAYLDRCPHRAFPLSGGRLSGTKLTCSVHCWEFDVCTGKGINPQQCTLTTVPIEQRDGGIWLDVTGLERERGGN